MSFSAGRADLRRYFAFVPGHNFRSAMGDDCVRHAFFFAPCQLRANGRMTDERFAALANE
jgi:hypothetical protein